MSDIVTAICRPLRLPSTRKCVLMSLAELASDEGMAEAPIAALCDWTCYGRTAVIEALKGLVDVELVELGKDKGRSSRYEVRLEKVAALVANQSASRTGTSAPSGRVNTEPVRQADGSATGNPSVSRTGVDDTRSSAGLVKGGDPSGSRTSTHPPAVPVGPDPSASRTRGVRQPDGLVANQSANRTGSSQLRAVCIKGIPSTSIEEKTELPFCAELELLPSTPDPVAIVFIPLNDGSQFPVTQIDIDEWGAAFPAIDVVGTLRRARVWCNDNPKKRKTKTGVRKFLSNWLGNEQNRGGGLSVNAHGRSLSGARPSRHSDLYTLNHTEGVTEDGSLV